MIDRMEIDVEGADPATTKDQMRELCAPYCVIKVPTKYKSGKFEISAPSKELGWQLIDNLSGKEFNGKVLTMKPHWPFDERD